MMVGQGRIIQGRLAKVKLPLTHINKLYLHSRLEELSLKLLNFNKCYWNELKEFIFCWLRMETLFLVAGFSAEISTLDDWCS